MPDCLLLVRPLGCFLLRLLDLLRNREVTMVMKKANKEEDEDNQPQYRRVEEVFQLPLLADTAGSPVETSTGTGTSGYG